MLIHSFRIVLRNNGGRLLSKQIYSSTIDLPVLFNPETKDQINKIKSELFSVCATCDRGFGSTFEDIQKIDNLVTSLQSLSSLNDWTIGLYPRNNSETRALIQGVWKLAYTTAYDVLSLSGNPLTQLQGIYQVISSDGSSVNVIDFAPKLQTIFPLSITSN
jgi:hypothetical protein